MRCAAGLSLLSLIAAPLAAQTGTIVAANMTASSASIVDVATGRTIATHATPPGPHEVAISNSGRWAVVSWYGDRTAIGNSLLVVDLEGVTPARTIDLGEYKRPHGMKFLPDDSTLIATSEATQRLVLVDLVRGSVLGTIETGSPQSHMVVITPDARWAFTTNIGPGTVSRIDLRARKLDTTFTVGTRIEGIAITPDGRELWLGGNDARTVFVLDAATGAVRAKIDGFGMPYRIGITPDGKSAIVSDPGAEKIHLIDVATHMRRAVIDAAAVPEIGTVNPSPQGVTVARDSRSAFVTLKAIGKVARVDLADAKVTSLLTVGGGSDGIGFSPIAARP